MHFPRTGDMRGLMTSSSTQETLANEVKENFKVLGHDLKVHYAKNGIFPCFFA